MTTRIFFLLESAAEGVLAVGPSTIGMGAFATQQRGRAIQRLSEPAERVLAVVATKLLLVDLYFQAGAQDRRYLPCLAYPHILRIEDDGIQSVLLEGTAVADTVIADRSDGFGEVLCRKVFDG